MIFSVRRKPGKAPALSGKSPVVVIASNDAVFAGKIVKTIGQWGFRHLLLDDSGFDQPEYEGEVVLLDIRDMADDAFGQVYSIKQQSVGIEVVLINKPDNVVASIAGMKAGAIDEIIVPFDTGALKEIITEVSKRVRAARAQKVKKPLLARFSEAMMAATFAQAGDFEGALDMLDSPVPLRTDKSTSNKKK